MASGMNLQARLDCYPASRDILLFWGYGKLAMDVYMLLSTVIPGAEVVGVFLLFAKTASQIAASVIYIILTAFWMMDLVLNSMFVFGVHKENINRLKKYYTYTKVLWVLVPILSFVYYMIEFDDLLWFVGMWYSDLRDRTFNNICVMFVTLIIQTIALLALNREMEKLNDDGSTDINNKIKGLQMGFIFRIEKIPLKQKVKEKKGDNNVENKSEINCDKSKLIE